jgi:hypothetical protein
MSIALALAIAAHIVPAPPRVTIVARARIMRGVRIDFLDLSRKPQDAIIGKGLIEFP